MPTLHERITTGVPGLDDALGGGLLPGTLTVIVGATGIGKTQLGIQFAAAGRQQEGRRGILLDMSARGDSQNHLHYAQRLGNWHPTTADASRPIQPKRLFDDDDSLGEYLRIFGYHGRRVTRQDLDFDQWHQWQGELNAKLTHTIAFFYGNFLRGVRRVVVDGIEPVDRPSESIQLHLFEYIYHQILRKDPEWVARDLLREQYRAHAPDAARYRYSPDRLACLLLCTSREQLLEQLISRRLDEGDVLANANTLIYMGKLWRADQLVHGLYIVKHRGSSCANDLLPYRIEDTGLVLENRHPEA